MTTVLPRKDWASSKHDPSSRHTREVRDFYVPLRITQETVKVVTNESGRRRASACAHKLARHFLDLEMGKKHASALSATQR